MNFKGAGHDRCPGGYARAICVETELYWPKWKDSEWPLIGVPNDSDFENSRSYKRESQF